LRCRAFVGNPLESLFTRKNETTQPMNLASECPNYEEEMFADIVAGSPPLGGKHLDRLNCAPAGTLAPGASRIFQMVFNVPADATPGTYTLVFQMGYSNAMTRVGMRAVV